MFCRLLSRQTGRGEGRGHLRHRDHHRPRRLVARGEVVQARALLQAEGIRRSTDIKSLLDNEIFTLFDIYLIFLMQNIKNIK